MTLEQITALAVAGESETLESKSTTGTRREAASTVCAMLNQRGAPNRNTPAGCHTPSATYRY